MMQIRSKPQTNMKTNIFLKQTYNIYLNICLFQYFKNENVYFWLKINFKF